MRKFLIASHGKLAGGFLSSLEMIAGAQPQVQILEAYMEDSFSMERVMMDLSLGLKPEDELIILTDMMGGSVTNQLLSLVREPQVYLVAGINLALVLEIVLSDPSAPVEKVIAQSIQQARAQMVFINNEMLQ